MIKSHKIVCYHLFYFIHRLYNILQQIKKNINILKNDIILTILKKGVVIVMCTLLIKILY